MLDARLGLWKRVTGSRVLLWKETVRSGALVEGCWVEGMVGTYEAEHLGGDGEV